MDLLLSQMQSLSLATQNILQIAACVGYNNFSTSVLSIILEKSITEVAQDLWEAMRQGLVLPVSRTYKIPLVFENAAELYESIKQCENNMEPNSAHEALSPTTPVSAHADGGMSSSFFVAYR